MRKAYVLTYPGLWLGGKAVVIAPNESRAKAELLKDAETEPLPELEEIEVQESFPLDKSGVIYNDNGDY